MNKILRKSAINSCKMNPLVYTKCQLCECDIPKLLYRIPGFVEDPRNFNVVKCKACGFVYINPRYSAQENFDLYEASYFIDETVDLSGEVRSFLSEKEDKINNHRIEWNHLKKHKTGGKILDLGSGPGFFLDALEGNWEKHAVDTSDFSIDNIQDSTVKKFKGTLFEAGFEESYFDVIYIGNTLDRLPNLKETLAELKRILNTNGVIFIITPNIGSWCAKVFKENYRLLYSNHLVCFTPETLKALFEQFGFRIFDIKYPYFGTSYFSFSGFFGGTGKIILQVLMNLLKIPPKMVSPPYRGNILSAIISK